MTPHYRDLFYFSQNRTLGYSQQLFSSLGVVLLLFMVGFEVSIDEMKAAGGSAAGVAVGGVIVPFKV